MYNSIILSKNKVNESRSNIDTMYQNRYDLIPNLIHVVKEYTNHEKGLLKEITEIRSSILSNQKKSKDNTKNENQLSETFKSIFAISENYPELKSNENFIQLQKSWFEIEDNIQAARRSYNSAVNILNNKKETFPIMLVAASMTIEDFQLYECSENAKVKINAKELFKN
ncbi:MAG: LemA family protein [Candidatus Gracilibacteria bacterium]|nr:LemA family protein [Candidatus Gracilibacteria bacterium]